MSNVPPRALKREMAFKKRPPAPRPPRRTFNECAEMLGVTRSKLMGLFRHYNGPAPVLNHTGGVYRVHANYWYDPREVKAWWNALPDEVKA